MYDNCPAKVPLPCGYAEFMRDWTISMVYVNMGWFISPSWEKGASEWDGMIYCPDHEVAYEDYANDYEDHSNG